MPVPVPEAETEPEAGAEADRAVCAEAPAVFDLLCRSYELLKEHYVDDIPDEDLAVAAARGVREAGLAPPGEQDEAAPLCALPAPAFEQTCVEIDAVGDTAAAVWAASEEMFAFLGDPNTFLMSRSEYEALLSRLKGGTPYAGIGIESGPAGRHRALPRSLRDVPAGCRRSVRGQSGRASRTDGRRHLGLAGRFCSVGLGLRLGRSEQLRAWRPGEGRRRAGRPRDDFHGRGRPGVCPCRRWPDGGGQDRLPACRLIRRPLRPCTRPWELQEPARFRHRGSGRRPAGQPRGLPSDRHQHRQHVPQRPAGRHPGSVQARHPPASWSPGTAVSRTLPCFPSRWRWTSRRPRRRKC